MACELMQIDLRTTDHLRYAESLGLVPSLEEITCNADLHSFLGPRFRLKRAWTDWPGYLAFKSPIVAHLAYFSRWSKMLHRLLYIFREPFYDYGKK